MVDVRAIFGKWMMVVVLVAGLIGLGGTQAIAAGLNQVKVETQHIQMTFDGQGLQLPDGQYSFIYDGRTYVPIRYMSYALLMNVDWSGANNQVTISEPSAFQLGELKKKLQQAVSGEQVEKDQSSITLTKVSAKLLFQGEEKTLPDNQTLFNYNGSIYVPLRFLSESAGTYIAWDPVTRTVSGESKAYLAEQAGSGAGTGDGGGTGGSGGNTGGIGVEKPTYEAITTAAHNRLEQLRGQCKSTLLTMGLDYLSLEGEAKAAKLVTIYAEIDQCTAQFEAILTDVSAQLTSHGYSTAVIAEYRAEFESEMEAGRELAESL